MTGSLFHPAPFIVGVGRSGTTLLRLMLDAHPELAIPTETHFLPAVFATAEAVQDPDAVLNTFVEAPTWPNMHLDSTQLMKALRDLRPLTGADAARAFYRAYAGNRGKVRWGDKTPPYRACMLDIALRLPEARFVHIIRDGRDVALSYRGLWFGPGDDLEAQARFWVKEIESARVQARDLPHYMEVRFEDLISRPEEVLRRICEFLDLPFDPTMLRYSESARERLGEYVQPFGPQGRGGVSLDEFLGIHMHTQSPPDASRTGRWRRELSQEELRKYQAVAGTTLGALGYELA